MTSTPTIREVDRDPLQRMRAYQLAKELRTISWADAEALRQQPITSEIAPQLYLAVGSIAANLAEGYSRSSGKDRAHIFEYALGSTRETLEWYQSGLPVLGEDVVHAREDILVEIRRLLIATIPRERTRTIRPGG